MNRPSVRLALLLCFALLLFALIPLLSRPGWLQTGMNNLLPKAERPDAVWQAADNAQERQMNGHILLLLGAPDRDSAHAAADQLAAHWQASGLFVRVDSRLNSDMPALRHEIKRLGIALLPRAQAALLQDDPARYFRERAEALFNPFAIQLLPPDEDWLGISRFVFDKAPSSRLTWDNGYLSSEHDGLVWVWLRAQLQETPDAAALLGLLEDSRAQIAAQGGQLLASGGALFAADTRLQAEQESTRLSTIGILLTFALLFAVFRSLRILILLLPLACGVLAGLVATLAAFGDIHVLTVVIGTSLIGVLIDFPLHWLTPARFHADWQAESAMQRILPVFLISLGITALGYLLLWFTPLPVLRQTAVFSCAALLAAFAATAALLPPLFRTYHPRQWYKRLPHIPFLPVLIAALLAMGGIFHANWRDDLRDWARLSPELLAHTRHIAAISGLDNSGRYLLVQADSADALLHRDAAVLDALQTLRGDGTLEAAQGVSQWLLPTDTQHALHQQLRHLAQSPDSYASLLASGIDGETLRSALSHPGDIIPLVQGLDTPLAEAWRDLYLGAIDGQYASIIRLYGLTDSNALAALVATQPCTRTSCVRLMDKAAHLNTLFQHTRNQAAWLKIASWLLAWIVLVRIFGLRQGSLILAPPLAAALATLGVLGWLAVPISLFALFGLLLAAAIGVDYSVYALHAKDSRAAKQASMSLAALTTALSFLLLASSNTPAVAAFGLAVTLGVAWNWLFASVLLSKKEK